MSKAIKNVSYCLTLAADYNDGNVFISKGRNFEFTPKEWKSILKTKMVPIDVAVYDRIHVSVKRFKVEKITHIVQFIIEKIKVA